MAGKINVPITTAVQGIANTQRQLSQLSRGIQTVGKTAGLAAIGFAAFSAGLKGADFAISAIAGARDLERNMLGLKTVFEEVTPQMRQFTRNAEQVGLSLNEASKSSVFIGSVLKQSGFSIQETADLTERLVRLGTDLSLTYGYDVQEALLGMTALFRGEYDPIEKFGVAMKQSEINAELAARKLDHLTGAQRRFAEQQIRVELLFQRSADAQGAFERGAGTLAVEQLKLQAMFNNLRDTAANNLLPAIGLLTQSFREALEGVEPKIKESFEELEPVLYDLGNILIPAATNAVSFALDAFGNFLKVLQNLLDPTTQVGGAISDLALRIDSLFTTLSNTTPTADQTRGFEFLANVVSDVVGLLGRVIYWIEVLATKKRIWEEFFAAIFQGDWDTLFQDWNTYADAQIANIGLTDLQSRSQYALNYELQKTELYLKKGNTAWANSWIARGEWAKAQGLVPKVENILPSTTDFSTDGKKSAKNYVDEFFKQFEEDVKKQIVRQQLALRGASEGLIDAILGSEGWMKIWLSIKQGKIVLQDLQDQFYRTAAGAKELQDAAKKAADEMAAYQEKVAAIEEALAEQISEIREKAKEAKEAFRELLDGFDILPTIERQFGKFEGQVVDYLASIEESLKTAFENGDILQRGYNRLRDFARQELALLQQIGRQRDELAERFDLAKGLIDNYKKAFTAALNLTTLFSQLKEETETKTVTSVSRGLVRLGGAMREFEVTISSSFEEAMGGVQNKAQSVLNGFRDMAEKARAFAENLRTLRAMGLDPMLFNQLVEAGIEAGGETAQALVEGGQSTISELNALFAEIDAVGGSLGEEVAASLYGSGVNMANGLLAGLQSMQEALEAQAISMADAFAKAFEDAVNRQINRAMNQAIAAAEAAASAQIAAIPVPKPQINTAALSQINSLIAGAQSYIQNVGNAAQAAGGAAKLEIYQGLQSDILAGRPVNLTGVTSGLSTSQLQAITGRSTPTVSNTYNVSVTSDSRVGGARAGEAIVESLQKFGQTNGNFVVGVSG